MVSSLFDDNRNYRVTVRHNTAPHEAPIRLFRPIQVQALTFTSRFYPSGNFTNFTPTNVRLGGCMLVNISNSIVSSKNGQE
jgi:hypothetical protein